MNANDETVIVSVDTRSHLSLEERLDLLHEDLVEVRGLLLEWIESTNT